jgi:hypothetical protein
MEKSNVMIPVENTSEYPLKHSEDAANDTTDHTEDGAKHNSKNSHHYTESAPDQANGDREKKDAHDQNDYRA